ncbi:hypothetical protein DFJ74DRAFT_650452 [Hyaloraphidium curvatum]|nr:hypothetical protein DFJ74DRAFT_650452 [Hyaloraphidium curvatum]
MSYPNPVLFRLEIRGGGSGPPETATKVVGVPPDKALEPPLVLSAADALLADPAANFADSVLQTTPRKCVKCGKPTTGRAVGALYVPAAAGPPDECTVTAVPHCATPACKRVAQQRLREVQGPIKTTRPESNAVTPLTMRICVRDRRPDSQTVFEEVFLVDHKVLDMEVERRSHVLREVISVEWRRSCTKTSRWPCVVCGQGCFSSSAFSTLTYQGDRFFFITNQWPACAQSRGGPMKPCFDLAHAIVARFQGDTPEDRLRYVLESNPDFTWAYLRLCYRSAEGSDILVGELVDKLSQRFRSDSDPIGNILQPEVDEMVKKVMADRKLPCFRCGKPTFGRSAHFDRRSGDCVPRIEYHGLLFPHCMDGPCRAYTASRLRKHGMKGGGGITTFRSCEWCQKTTDDPKKDLKRCSVCKSVFYCSPECARADRPRHSEWCVPPNSALGPTDGGNGDEDGGAVDQEAAVQGETAEPDVASGSNPVGEEGPKNDNGVASKKKKKKKAAK